MNFQDRNGVSIIIPTYNGKELLQCYLGSVIEAVNHFEGQSEIIIVDDASTDSSIEYLRQNFPRVKVLSLCSNRGFSRACNYGAQNSKYPSIIFLNNDVRVAPDFITPLVSHFKRENIFAIAPKSITFKLWLGNESVSQAFFTKGVFSLVHPSRGREPSFEDKMRPILYCCGSGFACSRKKFLELGGFDEIFLPFYWEDVDLCYRAWKRGWAVYYDPRSVIYHQHGSTILRKVRAPEQEIIFLRNAFLFTWKNITSMKMISQYIFYTPYWIFRNLFNRRCEYLFSWFQAILRIKKVLAKRRVEICKQKWTDERVLRESWL